MRLWQWRMRHCRFRLPVAASRWNSNQKKDVASSGGCSFDRRHGRDQSPCWEQQRRAASHSVHSRSNQPQSTTQWDPDGELPLAFGSIMTLEASRKIDETHLWLLCLFLMSVSLKRQGEVQRKDINNEDLFVRFFWACDFAPGVVAL